jgi:hypothetical protein
MPKQKPDNNTAVIKAAKEYVSQQIKTMKEFGSAPKLSTTAYKELVQEVADATK